jgi:hypothetical protein
MKTLVKRLVLGSGKKARHVLAGIGRGIQIVADPAHDSQRLIGLAEAELNGAFRRMAPASATFIDVGASNGWYCLLVRKLNPRIFVIACEPQDYLGKEFAENAELNGLRGDGMQFVRRLVGEREMTIDELAAGRSDPILIKVDVEGAEGSVLRSGAQTLATKRCGLIIETHSTEAEEDCVSQLQALGYKCELINPAWYRRFIPEQRPITHNRWLIAERS